MESPTVVSWTVVCLCTGDTQLGGPAKRRTGLKRFIAGWAECSLGQHSGGVEGKYLGIVVVSVATTAETQRRTPNRDKRKG